MTDSVCDFLKWIGSLSDIQSSEYRPVFSSEMFARWEVCRCGMASAVKAMWELPGCQNWMCFLASLDPSFSFDSVFVASFNSAASVFHAHHLDSVNCSCSLGICGLFTLPPATHFLCELSIMVLLWTRKPQSGCVKALIYYTYTVKCLNSSSCCCYMVLFHLCRPIYYVYHII